MIQKLWVENKNYTIMELCTIFNISKTGYSHHFSAKKTATEVRKIELLAAIKNINNDRKLRCYGSPRMVAELRARGYKISENTVAKLMREHGIFAHKAKPWKPKTTMQDKTSMPGPNLLKNQHSSRFGVVLVAEAVAPPGIIFSEKYVHHFLLKILALQNASAASGAFRAGRSISRKSRWRLGSHG